MQVRLTNMIEITLSALQAACACLASKVSASRSRVQHKMLQASAPFKALADVVDTTVRQNGSMTHPRHVLLLLLSLLQAMCTASHSSMSWVESEVCRDRVRAGEGFGMTCDM